jgi:hypothetical protein
VERITYWQIYFEKQKLKEVLWTEKKFHIDTKLGPLKKIRANH